ncbi:hypothetical protein L4X63_15730 [Geomonas sp. Red32]|uniref:hypothetical protein n=1 Tax=Geomonas sp. Red32 TaxID=2912856 RepID=UPI00202D05B5|nr:hypothetical protein [Geomonas sp. Red32]MCM0083042.1 hypothetical protein [Geomonas sp. Red32]
MNRLNWKVILSNVQEAREELEKIESRIASSKKPDETELELSLRHAYHHLNTAWNARHAKTDSYRTMTEDDFKAWGLFPSGLDDVTTYGDEDEL